MQIKLELSAISVWIFVFYYEYVFFMWLSVRMSARDFYMSDDIYMLRVCIFWIAPIYFTDY